MLERTAKLAKIAKDELRFRNTFVKYRDFTIVPKSLYTANLHLAAKVRDVEGDVVECGTWRGGMIAGIADTLGANRRYHLFDSYEGMPPAKEIDGEAALAWERNSQRFDNLRASVEDANKAMSMSAATDYVVVKGWFHETLPSAVVDTIALLRLDADWYDSTKAILDNFAHCVVPGGLIIVDDYYTFEGCARAVNECAAQRSWMIRQHRLAGVCYILT